MQEIVKIMANLIALGVAAAIVLALIKLCSWLLLL